MRKTLQRLFVFAIFLLLTFFVALMVVPRMIPQPLMERKVVENIEASMEGVFLYESMEITYFPVLTVHFKDVDLSANNENLRIQADAFSLRMSLISLFLRKFDVANLSIQNGNLVLNDLFGEYLNPVTISNMTMDINQARNKALKTIEFKGSYGNDQDNIKGRALIHWETFLTWNWKNAAAEGMLQLGSMDVRELNKLLKVKMPVDFNEGEIAAKLTLSKKQEKGWMDVHTEVNLTNLGYHLKESNGVASKSLDATLSSQVGWNPSTEEFRINQMVLDLPFAKMNIDGQVIASTGEIQNMRISASELVLEEIPQYLVFLEKAIPVNFGFSGMGQLDMTLEGTWDHLSFFANLDLKDAIVTYAKMFSKPKEMPMLVSFDAFLKYGKMLEGDFSVNFRGARGKGTFTEFNLATSEGQLNFITNKFDLKNWKGILLPLNDFDIGGQVKVLTNMEGDFKDWKNLKKVLNLTLEEGSVSRGEGRSFERIKLALDYSEFIFSVKESTFEVAGTPVTVDFQIFNLQANPKATVKVSAEAINPIQIINTVQDVSLEWIEPQTNRLLEYSKIWMKQIFPKNQSAEKLRTLIEYEDGNWIFREVDILGYDGRVNLNGDLEQKDNLYAYDGILRFENINLGNYLYTEGQNSIISGHLDAVLDFEVGGLIGSEKFETTSGEGQFVIKNGSFANVDVWKTLTNISEFKQFEQAEKGETGFERLASDIRMNQEGIAFKKMTLLTNDFTALLEGEANFKGIINCRMNTYLAPAFTKELIAEEGRSEFSGTEMLGPIPFLLSGPITNPEFRVDSERVSKIKKALDGKRSYESLEDFLILDFLDVLGDKVS